MDVFGFQNKPPAKHPFLAQLLADVKPCAFASPAVGAARYSPETLELEKLAKANVAQLHNSIYFRPEDAMCALASFDKL